MVTNSDQNEEEADDSTNIGLDSNRRRVLQVLGSSAFAGIGTAQLTGLGAAETTREEEHASNLQTEELPPREAGQLRGEVMSSSAFKTVRQELRQNGFRPEFGDSALAVRVTNAETGEEWPMFKVGCTYTVEDSDEKSRGGLLYASKKDGKFVVRGLSQHENEPVEICDCQAPADDFSGSKPEESAVKYRVPIAEGGE